MNQSDKKNKSKKNVIKEYIFDGFGFPVILNDILILEIQGEKVPDIDYETLRKGVLITLSQKQSLLTGDQVKFVRKNFELNLVNFGKRFGVSHAAVKKWENKGELATGMDRSTELGIRLFVLDRLGANDDLFRRTFREFNWDRRKETEANNILEYNSDRINVINS